MGEKRSIPSVLNELPAVRGARHFGVNSAGLGRLQPHAEWVALIGLLSPQSGSSQVGEEVILDASNASGNKSEALVCGYKLRKKSHQF